MPPNIHWGAIPTFLGSSDIDGPAITSLIDNAVRSDEGIGSESYHKEGLKTPPNLTNIYILRIPAMPTTLKQFEKKHRLPREKKYDKYGKLETPYLYVVLCDTPSRVSPIEFPKIADERFGKGNWVFATQSNGKLEILHPNPSPTIKQTKRPDIELKDPRMSILQD